ncbi:DUF3180 domain-containing protein [Gulosibacter sp. GYB002]|uniref:DUF3180 domain-containing protein n=1 Tax=Gulosibacter sp. GYB002 TaxID=2994391 RepID=UPI002F96B385
MTPTNPLTLVLAVIAGGVVGWAFELWLVSTGSAAFIPSPLLGITLAVIGLAVLAVAWPVRGYTSRLREAVRRRQQASDAVAGTAGHTAAEHAAAAAEKQATAHRVNPFRAVFALALAKAASLVGALFLGFTGGTLLWLISRTVVNSGALLTLFSSGGALVLLVAGLIAESWCRLPPQDTAGASAEAS